MSRLGVLTSPVSTLIGRLRTLQGGLGPPVCASPTLAYKYLILQYLSRIMRRRINESPCCPAFTGVGALVVIRAARRSGAHGRGSRRGRDSGCRPPASGPHRGAGRRR